MLIFELVLTMLLGVSHFPNCDQYFVWADEFELLRMWKRVRQRQEEADRQRKEKKRQEVRQFCGEHSRLLPVAVHCHLARNSELVEERVYH